VIPQRNVACANQQVNHLPNSSKVLKSFCTTREAADLLGVSLRTAQLWTEDGLLQAWKTDGGHRRISRQSVEQLLAEKQGETPAAPKTVSDRLTILVVEDTPEVLRVYERIMARWPFKPQVITARDGMEALLRLGMARPDLLILDLVMPQMDGFQMLAMLQNMPELSGMTSVVVTGLDAKTIALKGGVPAGIPILPKPVPFERLLDIATVVAERKRRAAI